MNEDNYQFLTRALAKFGFEDSLNDALHTKMKLNFQAFDLKAQVKHGADVMIHDLHFERKNDKGFYFLNSETVTLQKENQEAITQKFAFFNQKGFSNEEAYNLMSGRPVRNTVVINDESVTRWTYIDFNAEKNKNGNYVFRNPKEDDLNFNLVTALSKLPIQNLSPQEKEAMLQGLRSGNLVPASLKVEGVWERTYLEANPLMGKINVYDANLNKIALSNSKIQVLADDTTLKNVPEAVVKLLDKDQSQGQGRGKKIG